MYLKILLLIIYNIFLLESSGYTANLSQEALRLPLICKTDEKKGTIEKILTGRHERVITYKYIIPPNAIEGLEVHGKAVPLPPSWKPRVPKEMTKTSVESLFSIFETAFNIIDYIRETYGDSIIIRIGLYGSVWNGKADEKSDLDYTLYAYGWRDGRLWNLPDENIGMISMMMINKIGWVFHDYNIGTIESSIKRPYQEFVICSEDNYKQVLTSVTDFVGTEVFVEGTETIKRLLATLRENRVSL